MPTSTERGSGFTLSKWELKYLKCRYRAHRNKIAAATPAIDDRAPPERPHVRFKNKKALNEERRQVIIVQENLRILNKTAYIMSSGGTTSKFSASRESSGYVSEKDSTNEMSITKTMKRNTRILLQWFLHKFGNYIPWWAEIRYKQ